MSDRVEERREAERILNAQIERQRADAKVASEKGKFDRVQAQAGAKARSNMQQQRGKENKSQARAGVALAARSGIASKNVALEHQGGNARMLAARDAEHATDKSAGRQAMEMLVANEKASSAAHTGISSAGKRQQGSTEEGREEGGKSGRNAETTRGEQAVVSMGGASPLAALSGVSPKAGGAGGATKLSPATQKVLDEIVKGVQKGVVAGKARIDITLQPEVLGGATLSLMMARGGGGLQLAIESSSKEASDLLASGDNARALAQQLAARNITLTHLRVGAREVIRQ